MRYYTTVRREFRDTRAKDERDTSVAYMLRLRMIKIMHRERERDRGGEKESTLTSSYS